MSKNKPLSIYELILVIEENSSLIVENWIEIHSVKSTLENRNISIKKFKNNYALPILKYFIDIIKGDEEQGDCPIMTKLVNYLLIKNINPKEVFDICMGLRNSFSTFILQNEHDSKKTILYLNEISTIFDSNLSGVLDIFTNLHLENHKKLQIAKNENNKLQQILKIINLIDIKLMIVQNSHILLANKSLLELLGIDNLEDLYEKSKNGFYFFNDINIYEDEFKNDVSLWMKKLSTKSESFQVNIYDRVRKRTAHFLGHITSMGIKTEQYIITLSDITQEIKTQQLLQDNVTHDEITGFRNYPTFEHLLIERIEKVKELDKRIFLAVVNIANLKEINDNYNSEKGDAIIAEVAEDLRSLNNNDLYFARLEEGRFGVLLDYPNEQLSYDWCVKLLHKLNERDIKKTIAVTEIDLGESVNKLLLRVYNLLESSNDSVVENDFINVVQYQNLPNQTEFVKRLAKLAHIKTTVFYNELAISNESKIINFTDENVTISFSKKQMQISSINTQVYFKLLNIGYMQAKIYSLDAEKEEVIIDRFKLDKHTPLNRQMYRISASTKIKAYISFNDRDYDVEILDMNYEYISIKIDRKRNFDINTLIYLDMLLPISDLFESCSANATIIRIDKIKDAYKMILLCHFDYENRQVLKEYISKHQMEIINSFKN